MLSGFFDRGVYFQGIGVKGLGLRQIRSLPSRLLKRGLPTNASSRSGILPVLPMRRSLPAGVSAWLIRQRLKVLIGGRGEEWVLWIRFPSPELVAAIRGVSVGRLVYEPVDHYLAEPAFSANDRQRLAHAEQELARCSMVVTASSRVAKRFEAAPGGSYWLPIGADASVSPKTIRALATIPRPRLAVVGSLDELADEHLLYDLAVQRPQWQLILAGPRACGWGRQLQPLSNVHWLGALDPPEAHGVIADCDVALNPCVLNDWTESALPVKVFDYLAEGPPIVSTPMSELDAFRELITVARASEFIPAIERALVTDDANSSLRRKDASRRFTAQERARRAYQLIEREGWSKCN